VEVKAADETVGYLQLRICFKGCKDFDLGHCYKEKVDPKYNLLLTSQYKHSGRKEAYASVSSWCDAYYPE
jgi:hypothetical protein